MKLKPSHIALAAALAFSGNVFAQTAAAPAPAPNPLSFNISLTTNYKFRGQDQDKKVPERDADREGNHGLPTNRPR